ncbi:MAG: hypothetical protein JWR72_1766 [Flavisolibacter sp.]|jgi:hypothetical protein|nr:hypothetical protein [Flavisolibacter sp.]
MKKLAILMLCLVAFAGVQGQNRAMLRGDGAAKLFSRKVTIDIDNAEERKWISFKGTRIKDELGKVKSFNSVIDAMNFLGRSGWQ